MRSGVAHKLGLCAQALAGVGCARDTPRKFARITHPEGCRRRRRVECVAFFDKSPHCSRRRVLLPARVNNIDPVGGWLSGWEAGGRVCVWSVDFCFYLLSDLGMSVGGGHLVF